jgi:hypothetical protein
MGSDASDLYEAIFDLEVEADPDFFGDPDEHDERPALRSIASAESLRLRRMRSENSTMSAPRLQVDPEAHRGPSSAGGGSDGALSRGASRSPRKTAASVSPQASPRRRRPPPIVSAISAEMRGPESQPSPLARLFGVGGAIGMRSGRTISESTGTRSGEQAQGRNGGLLSAVTGAQLDASVRRLEAMLEDAKELPVQRVKEEMKELQVGVSLALTRRATCSSVFFARNGKRGSRICC